MNLDYNIIFNVLVALFIWQLTKAVIYGINKVIKSNRIESNERKDYVKSLQKELDKL